MADTNTPAPEVQPQAPQAAPAPDTSGGAAPAPAADTAAPVQTPVFADADAAYKAAPPDKENYSLTASDGGWSWIRKAADGTVGAPGMVMHQVRDIARGAVQGLIGGFHETATSIDSAATAVTTTLKKAGVPDVVVDKDGLHVDTTSGEDQSAGQLSSATDVGKPFEPESALGHMSEGVSQFLTGMAAFGGVGKSVAALGGHVAGEITKGTLANAFSFDSYEGNLADLMERYPSIAQTIGPYLQSNHNDTEAVARLKRGIEGLALGSVGEGIFWGVRTLKALRAGDAAAATEASDETAKALQQAQATPEQLAGEAPASSAEATGQGATPLTGNATRVPTGVKAELAPPAPISDDFMDTYRQKLARNEDWLKDGGVLPEEVPARFGENLDVGNAISTLEEANVAGFGQHVDGTVRSLKEVRKNANRLANILGTNSNELFSALQQDAGDMLHLDARITAYGDLYASQAAAVSKLGAAIAEGRPGEFETMEALEGAFKNALQRLQEIRYHYRTISGEAARAMGAQRAVNRLKVIPNFDNIGNMNSDELRRAAMAVDMAAKSGATAADLTKVLQASMSNKFIALVNGALIHSLLSLGTVGVKASTDVAMLATAPIERLLAGLYTLNGARMKAGLGLYMGYARFLFDAMSMAGKAFKLGGQITDGAHGIVLPPGLGDGSVFNNLVNGNQGYALVNALTKYVTIPTRVIGTNDEFTKSLMYRAEIARKAALEGADVSERMAQAFDAAGRATDQEALLVAQQSTASQPAVRGSENVWFGDRSLTAATMDFANAIPVARQVIPFIKVVGNLGRYAWQHTPGLNLLQKQYMNDIRAGGELAANAWSKMTTGAAIWGVGIYLANSGHIIGTLHPDPMVQRQIEQQTGMRHNSIVINNEDGSKDYIPLAQISDPIGPILATAADIAKSSHYLSDGEYAAFAVAASAAIGEGIEDKNYLRGVTNLIEAFRGAYSPGDSGATRAKKFMAQWASGFVPSMLANKRGDDPYLREIHGYLDGVTRKLPGSVGLDPQRNAIGEPVATSTALGSAELSPFQRSHADNDQLNAELARQLAIGDRPIPRLPKKIEIAKGRSVDLTTIDGGNGFSAYDRLQELYSSPPGQPTLRDALTKLIGSDRYKSASEGIGQYEGSKRWLLDTVIGTYQRSASKALLKEAQAAPKTPLGSILTSAKADAENRAAALRGLSLPHPELVRRDAFKEAIQPSTD